jgi:YegS/Rv2252/BmrU family lipid kinase
MKLSLIVNPQAGGGAAGRSLHAVLTRLHDLGLEPDVRRTDSLDHARALAREATAAGHVAVAFGGDGLIGAVADALRDGDGLLGALPGGRGNDFIRALGIPSDPVAACAVLAGGHERRLDLGRAGERTFIGIASCGFDSIANRVANETRIVRGNLVYAYGALRALAGWSPAAFTVTIDGAAPRQMVGYTVAAANSPYYGGGMAMAPDANLTDGLLDVVLVAEMPRLRFLRLLPTVFSGAHVQQPNVEVLRARSISVSASRPFTLFADGDPIGELPLDITVLPGAVRVLVPAALSPATTPLQETTTA